MQLFVRVSRGREEGGGCSPVPNKTSKKNITKLQTVQSFAARIIVAGARRFDNITQPLNELHWLPV